MSKANNAAEVLDRIDFNTISFVDIRAGRLDLSEETEGGVQRSTQLLIGETEEEIFGRVALTVRAPQAGFFLDAIAVYLKTEDFTLSKEAVKEFLEKIVIFAVWPYLRSELQSLCDSLLVDRIVLPVIRQGEIQITSALRTTPDSAHRLLLTVW